VVLANQTDPSFANNIADTWISAPDACLPPPSGIVGWWPAEGSAAHAIGTNNGLLGRPASFGPGLAGQAFLFDGVNDYVNVADAPALRPSSLTLDGWGMIVGCNTMRSAT